jgi:acyl-CoA synthetase (AMP-forming)/AMP-acid ligase II
MGLPGGARPVNDYSFPSWTEAVAGASDTEPTVRLIDLDLGAIIYTSGSTGSPRGAMLSHLNIRSNTESIVEYLHLTSADRVMCVLPFYYVYGLSLLHTHVAVGGSVIVDPRFAFPNVVLKAMKEHRATGFAGVPSTFALLMHRSNLCNMQFPDLRYVTQAGGGMPPARIREWLEKGPHAAFYVMYGATEASARLTYLEPADLERKMGSIGRAIPNVEMLVLKDDGQVAAADEVGELVARGSNVSSGYWNNVEGTAERFGRRGYMTGDLGYADEEGFLFLVGRRHDMIKVGAHRVSAKEVEDVINEHPAVSETAVVPVQHRLLGEAPLAFITTRQDAAPDIADIRAFCQTRLASHKVPVEFVILPAIPKNAIGKTDQLYLRRVAAERSLASLRAGGLPAGGAA